MPYDPSKYKIQTWRHPVKLHWILNPVLAINELVLGQRIPKVTLIEKDAPGNLQKRTKIPCPHCGTIHASLKWSARNNAYKNWFGLYCDHCGGTIPCLSNWVSLVVLGLAFPIWYWVKDKWRKDWLERQPERYQNLDLENIPSPYEGYGWVTMGLRWALFMYIFTTVMYQVIDGDEISFEKLLKRAVIWLIGGLIYGYIMRLSYAQKK